MSNFLVKGYIEWANKYGENFWLLTVKTDNGKSIKISGNMEGITFKRDEYYGFICEESYHPRYGKGVKFTDLDLKVKASNKKAIIRVLSNEEIKGVSEKSAEKIYSHFGDETITILSRDPEKIREVKLNKKQYEAIIDYMKKTYGNDQQYIDLQLLLDVDFSKAKEVFSALEAREHKNPLKAIENNPYILLELNLGFGFKTVDEIAMRKLNFMKDSNDRLKYCAFYTLQQALGRGNACLPKERFYSGISHYTELPVEEVLDILIKVELSDEVHYTYEEEMVYLNYCYLVDCLIAKKLSELSKNVIVKKPNIREDLKNLTKQDGIILHELQIEAIENMINNNITIISGGPGTGKTTILKYALQLFKQYNLSFQLSAPTGVAAKKMSDSTGEEAKTIHRTLEFDPMEGFGGFKRNKDNPLESDVLVNDETSMVDMFLMANYLNAVSFGTRLIFLGDPDQLESVSAGRVFGSFIESGNIKHVKLEYTYRQGEGSTIKENAHRVNKGMPLLYGKQEGFKQDFFYREEKTAEGIVNKVKEILGFYNVDDIQIITPKRVGSLGAEQLNVLLQDVVNPASNRKKELKYPKTQITFREGSRVMQIENNYEKDVMNGIQGKISKIEVEEKKIQVKYEDKQVWYEFEELDQLRLALCITTHKSQGSEYKTVIFLAHNSDINMLYKSLVYTAMTRAREQFILVGDKEVLERGLKHSKETKRESNLHNIINKYMA